MDPLYNAWADDRLVAFLRSIERTAKMEAVLAHLVVAGETWLARLKGESPKIDLWPTIPFEEAASRLTALDARLDAPRDPEARIRYRTMAGVEFENSVAETMAHVLNHATYHRGEIAGLLLAIDAEPPIMDLIAYFRERN